MAAAGVPKSLPHLTTPGIVTHGIPLEVVDRWVVAFAHPLAGESRAGPLVDPLNGVEQGDGPEATARFADQLRNLAAQSGRPIPSNLNGPKQLDEPDDGRVR
jgi:hypothetical protein